MNEVYDRVDKDGVVIGRGVRTIVVGPSRTKQSMKDECDINNIMKRYERTGLITHNSLREAYFADVSEVPDFAEAVAVVRKAEDMFMSLPAKVRIRFNNDPAEYVRFCGDPSNEKEMVELGLIDVAEPVKPIEVIVTNPLQPEVK